MVPRFESTADLDYTTIDRGRVSVDRTDADGYLVFNLVGTGQGDDFYVLQVPGEEQMMLKIIVDPPRKD